MKNSVPTLDQVLTTRREEAARLREEKAAAEDAERAAAEKMEARIKTMFVPYIVETEGVLIPGQNLLVEMGEYVVSYGGRVWYVAYHYEVDGECRFLVHFAGCVVCGDTGCRVLNVPTDFRWSDMPRPALIHNAAQYQTLADAIFLMSEPAEDLDV